MKTTHYRCKRDYQSPQKEIQEMADKYAESTVHLLKQSETHDTKRHQRDYVDRKYRIGMQQLASIVEVLQNECREIEGDLPTSFASVEMEIATSISQLIHGSLVRSVDTQHTLALLRDYKVFGFLPAKNPTVSLDRIHQLCQDNFPDSSLRKFLNFTLGCHKDVTSKAIVF